MIIPSADALRHARISAGLTQERMGEELGVTREYICAMENGRKPIHKRIMLAAVHVSSVHMNENLVRLRGI